MMSFIRIKGIVAQNIFHIRHALEDIIETFYWPIIDIVVWGFITVYVGGIKNPVAGIAGFLLGGIILWTIIWRAQQDISLPFLRNIWNRNLVNIFSTPLTQWEFITGTILLGFLKVIFSILAMAGLAFSLYSFNIFSLGLWFLPFFANLLIFGWILGLIITGLVIRYGMRIQALSWSAIFIIQPLSAVFYPVSVLPDFLQKIAWFLPSSHIFEGMRHVLSGRGLSLEHLIWAFALNIIYLVFAASFFNFMFKKSRENGRLVKIET